MTTEEKAQRYDEMSKEVKDFFDGKLMMYSDVKQTLNYLFPELQESEDKKIRKTLIEMFSSVGKKDWRDIPTEKIIAWLEKQGKSVNVDSILEKIGVKPAYLDGNAWCILHGDNIQNGICGFGYTKEEALIEFLKDLLEKQGEQKPTDKVEPKFHEGDWIIDKQGIVHQIEKVIENVTNNTFGYDLVGGGYFNEEVKSYRLWTIADAKDGNVLYSLDSNRPFIYKERNGYEQATAYCGLNIYGKFFVWNTKDCIITTDKYIPATKEQHDTLLKAMADAGYTFDFEKKELKLLISNGGDFESNNSKQNPTWSEEDEEMIDKIIDYIKPMPIFFESTKGKSGKEYTKEFIKNAIKWLKSIKGRIQPQQKWTEEDENGFGETLWAINKARTIAENENDMGNLWYAENWLTSLKERLS